MDGLVSQDFGDPSGMSSKCRERLCLGVATEGE